MGNRFARLNSRFLVLLLSVAMLATGCARTAQFSALEHLGRWQVADELECRTGHLLGPDKPPCHIAVPHNVQLDDGLSEDEAIAMGLWNNPAFQALLADLQITEADLIQACQLTNPQATTMFPLSVKQWEFTLFVPLEVLLVRPQRVAAAQLESQRVAERLVQDGLNVIRDVRTAYADVLQSEQELQLAEDDLMWRDEIARIAEARLQAGEVSELDASALRLDALVSQQQASQASREAELASERLRFQLGVASSGQEIRVEPPDEIPAVDFDAEELVAEAIVSRPDLQALNIALRAAGRRARLARFDYLNIHAMLPDINAKGEKGFEAGPGLQLFLPIFNQNQGAIARAEAEVKRLRGQYVTQRDTVALEVRQALAQLVQAQQNLVMWRDQITPQAEEAATSARKALEEDGVSLLVVLETTRQLRNARSSELQAKTDLLRAVAELERSVGRRLLYDVEPDSAEEAPVQPVAGAALEEGRP